MPDIPFYKTVMGQRFYESSVPAIKSALQALVVPAVGLVTAIEEFGPRVTSLVVAVERHAQVVEEHRKQIEKLSVKIEKLSVKIERRHLP